MSRYGTPIDSQPLTWWGNKPIYLTLYLTAALGLGTVLIFLIVSSDAMPSMLTFHNGMFFRGAYWQPLTYVFVNDLNLFTPLGLIMFYIWGVEAEKYLGRRQFCALMGLLILTPVVVMIAFYFLRVPGELVGDRLLLAGLLVTLAALYPNMDYFYGWIPLKWFAFAVIACGSITYFPHRDWAGLLSLWCTCLAAYLFIRPPKALTDFDASRWWPRKKPKLRVLPHPEPARPTRRASTAVADQVDEAEAEIDALLDKIAGSGLQSLSAAEKARLETLRQRMLRKQS
jgi:hypothetical protein